MPFMLCRSLLMAFVCAGFGLVAGCSSSPVPVFLGHLHAHATPLSESDPFLQGLELSLRDVQEEFKREFKGRPLHIRHGDGKGSLDLLETQAVRFAYLHRTPILIGGETEDEIRRLDRSKAVVFSHLGTPLIGVSDSVFYLGINPYDQAQALAAFAWEDLKLEKARLLQEKGSPASEAIVERSKVLKTESRLAISDARPYTPADLVQELQKEPTFLGTVQVSPLVEELFVRPRIRAAGVSNVTTEVLKGPLLAANGKVYFAIPFDPASESPEWKAFRLKYQEAFQGEPTWKSILGFESVQLASRVLRQAGSYSEKLSDDVVKHSKGPGATGTIFFSKSRQLQRPLWIFELGEKDAKIVKTVPAPETKD